MDRKTKDNKGFTLIELMVAMAVSSILMLAIMTTYENQLRSHLTQQSVADMHQNARAAMILMKNEIQMAGYDPTHKADARFTAVANSTIQFTTDLNGDGDCSDGNENVQYQIDGGNLKRATGGGFFRLLAENIEALDFTFFDGDMNQIDTAVALSENELDSIRLVQITVVVRSDDPAFSYKHTDINTYTNNLGTDIWQPADYAGNATARRVRLSVSVWCRNAGTV
jgi:type IV pilus assembly protein PilW